MPDYVFKHQFTAESKPLFHSPIPKKNYCMCRKKKQERLPNPQSNPECF